jgi:hypothetical protein
MRIRLTLLFVALCCLAAFSASRADAQSDRRMAFEVPFDFRIQGKRLPAGWYTVERLDQSNPAFLVIKAVHGSARRVFFTQRAEADGAGNVSMLVFTSYGDDRFLSKIWWGGDPNGRQLRRSDAEREWGEKGVEPTIIALTKK